MLIEELQDEKVAAEDATEAVGNDMMIVDPKSPLRHQYTFDQEARLESWAAPSEQLLSEAVQHSEFGSRYKLESFECKTTLCITKVSISVDKTTSDMELNFGWQTATEEMRQSELNQDLSWVETSMSIDISVDPPQYIYLSTFIKKDSEQN